MKKLIFVFFAFISLYAKSQIQNSKVTIDTSEFNVNIELQNDSIDHFGDTEMNISITNKSTTIKKILFDKHRSSQTGPWATSVIIYDVNNDIIRPNSPNFHASTLYKTEELEKFYTELNPKQKIDKLLKIKEISTLGWLRDGKYEIQINYHGILSNKVFLVVNNK